MTRAIMCGIIVTFCGSQCLTRLGEDGWILMKALAQEAVRLCAEDFADGEAEAAK